MSESDVSLSDMDQDVPSDKFIADQLRNTVESVFASNDLENLTVKRIRLAVTLDLALPKDFFLGEKWKSQSKNIIESAATRLQEASSQPEAGPPVERSRKISQNVTKPVKDSNASRTQESDLEAHPDAEALAKKRKTSQLPNKTPKRRKVLSSSPPDAAQDDSKIEAEAELAIASSHDVPEQDDESELSSLIDDSPQAKARQRKKRGSSVTETSTTNKSKVAKPFKVSKPVKDISPQDEEIKRLQSQLVKCGVRKLWGKELSRFDTAKEKIRHLRGMLEEVGMTGRFSEDKARQIKEERELKADLEAIKEGDEKWGNQQEEPRKKKVAKGLQALQDIVGDDEESD